MKGKPLLPALRTKKRYVVFELIANRQIDNRSVFDAIKKSFKDSFGTFGLGSSGLMNTNLYIKERGIVKINHKFLDQLRYSFSMIKQIKNTDVILKSVMATGVLRKAKLVIKEE